MKSFLFSSPGKVFVLLGTACLGSIIVALFLEHYLLLKPCLLCYAQRFCVYLLIFISLIAFLHKNQSLFFFRTYLTVASATILIGSSLSIRQLYLQSLPNDLVPTCGPDLEYLLETLPVLEVLLIAIKGDGNCAEVLWSFLGISIPGWLLIAFIVLFAYVLTSLYISKDLHSNN